MAHTHTHTHTHTSQPCVGCEMTFECMKSERIKRRHSHYERPRRNQHIITLRTCAECRCVLVLTCMYVSVLIVSSLPFWDSFNLPPEHSSPLPLSHKSFQGLYSPFIISTSDSCGQLVCSTKINTHIQTSRSNLTM